jgi:glycosyltransferase involved in cell wall biosynthesis
MRVVIVTSWPTDVIGGSGTAVFFNSFVAGLRNRGYNVDVIAPNYDISDYVTVTLQRFLFNTQLRTDPRVNNADVVIGFDFDGYGLDPAVRPPMISSAHAVYGDVIQWEEEPFRTMVESQAFFDRVAMQEADAVTAGSAYAKQRLVDLYGIDPHKIRVIPHGQELPTWVPLVDAEPRQPNDHPVILSVGKMYPRKRTDILLRAASLLLPKYPNLEVRVVGDGINWDNLHRIAEEIGISKNVTWLGHVTDDAQFAREWRQADIFCHPSSQETFGYVYLEAMRLGKPIVAVSAGAAPEVLGATARLAEPENPAALAAELEYFLQNETARQVYGSQAKVRAARYTVDAMIDGYEKVIEQAVMERAYVLGSAPAYVPLSQTGRLTSNLWL